MNSPTLSTQPIAGYYGKIPSLGDFITRRVAQNTISVWDNWLRHSLYEAKSALPPNSWNDQYYTSAVWNFIMPPSICGERMIGLIAASVDRVGRQFPFTLFQPLNLPNGTVLRLEQIMAFYLRHGPVMRALQQRRLNLEQLEQTLAIFSDWQATLMWLPQPATASGGGDILSVLNGSPKEEEPDDETTVTAGIAITPWPDLRLAEVMLDNTSYWWTNQAAGCPLRAFTHYGGLNDTLFKTLFSSLTG